MVGVKRQREERRQQRVTTSSFPPEEQMKELEKASELNTQLQSDLSQKNHDLELMSKERKSGMSTQAYIKTILIFIIMNY